VESKLEAIGFGFLIPIFFIESGINFDLGALIHRPHVLLLVPMFTAIFLVTRGLPTWAFFRGVFSKVEARSLAVLAATGLPIIVVITTLGVDEHRMKPQNAAALVAAGMLSVLIYPLIGLRLLGEGSRSAKAVKAGKEAKEAGPADMSGPPGPSEHTGEDDS
jgi:Kef-type K+ transport system membrane component KefB